MSAADSGDIEADGWITVHPVTGGVDVVINIPDDSGGFTNRQVDDVVRRALETALDRQEWREMGSPPGQRRAKKVKVSKEIVRVQDALTKPKRNINLD